VLRIWDDVGDDGAHGRHPDGLTQGKEEEGPVLQGAPEADIPPVRRSRGARRRRFGFPAGGVEAAILGVVADKAIRMKLA